jgi:ABC-type Zn uptake system ZnuABC Zn-binding protein ZnuA
MIRTVILVIALVAVGCGGKKAGGAGDKPKVAVSIFPLYDLTRRIAGDRLDVRLILPPGRSEHNFDPTPKEIAKLAGAKLAITVGLDMDLWAETTIRAAASDAKIFRVGEKVKTMPIDVEPVGEAEAHKGEAPDADDKPGAPDPHVWMDPERMIGVIDAIAGELAVVDPAGKDTFAKNAAVLKDSLTKLDAAISARSKSWTKHVIVTFHGSMSYFARRYGITIAAVIEPLAGKEPTATYITQVLGAIQKTQTAGLFAEPQLDRAPAEMIAREAKIPLGELDPVGGVAGRDSYEALLTWNTDQLEKVLK